jgi:hypothetical protein
MGLSELDKTGDGDPNFQGGMGCQYCDTLWASDASLTAHELRVHGDLLPEPALAQPAKPEAKPGSTEAPAGGVG